MLLETRAHKYANDRRGRRAGVRDLTVTDGRDRVTEYTWDVRDCMREARLPDGRRVVYDYDALGRRVHKRVFEGTSATPGRAVSYVWSGSVLALERSSNRPSRSFVHRPGQFEPLLQEERGEVFFYVLDRVGVPRELLDEGGRVAWSGRFSPWGGLEEQYVDPYRVQSGKSVSTPFRLLGQIFDEDTELAWTRFRVWDAQTGRWLSPDPLGLFGGANLFGFEGSPTQCIDPWGLATGPAHGADARRVQPGGAAPGDTLERRGTAPETPEELDRQSKAAMKAGFPHGVSVTSPERNRAIGVPESEASSATRQQLENAGFPVHSTPTKNDPAHHTVQMPDPVTPADADRFNAALGR